MADSAKVVKDGSLYVTIEGEAFRIVLTDAMGDPALDITDSVVGLLDWGVNASGERVFWIRSDEMLTLARDGIISSEILEDEDDGK